MKYYILAFVSFLLITLGFLWVVNSHVEENTQLTISPVVNTPVEDPVQTPPPSISIDTFFSPEELADTITTRLIDGYIELSWKALSKMKFNDVYDESSGSYIPYPIFHPAIKALNGKRVQIKGYVIPIEETEDESILVLSAYAYKNCFFCGGAGPETVMDIQLRKKQKGFKVDQTTSFRGKLKLNDSDLYYLNYILEDAVPMK